MKFKVPYYSDPQGIVFNDDFSVNFDFFERLPKNSPVVVDLSKDPYNVREINDLLKSRGIDTENIVFLTSNYDLNPTDHNIIFYPTWPIARSQQLKKLPIDIKRNHRVSCLNRIAKGHRLYLYYLLKDKTYFNQLVFTLQGLSSYDNDVTWDNGQIVGLNELPKKVKLELQRLNLNITTVASNDPNRTANDHSTNHIAYTDSYMNIVTETSHRLSTPFFSEKSIKPLASGQLFLFAGDQNSINALRSLGFETFDTAFDNHRYDNYFLWRKRIDSMVRLLDSVYDDVESIYFDNIQALKHNQDYALSDSFRNRFLKPLLDMDLVDPLNFKPA